MAGAEKNNPQYAWVDGKIVPWDDAKIHIRTDAFMYGANVFEGIRAYWNEEQEQLYIFKLMEHLDRLWESQKIMRITIPYTKEQIAEACREVLEVNGFRDDIHFRPTSYVGAGEQYSDDPTKVFFGHVITAVPRPTVETIDKGASVKISSWQRINDTSVPPRVKAGANYQNSRFASLEAKLDGYEGAILLNDRGKVAEGPGACVMMVRKGKVITPSVTQGILESITRASLIDLFRDELGIEVIEREIDRTELYIAEEAFFCGTGAEVRAIGQVDKHQIADGNIGPITRKIREVYFNIARGQNPKYSNILTTVYQRQPVTAR